MKASTEMGSGGGGTGGVGDGAAGGPPSFITFLFG